MGRWMSPLQFACPGVTQNRRSSPQAVEQLAEEGQAWLASRVVRGPFVCVCLWRARRIYRDGDIWRPVSQAILFCEARHYFNDREEECRKQVTDRSHSVPPN